MGDILGSLHGPRGWGSMGQRLGNIQMFKNTCHVHVVYVELNSFYMLFPSLSENTKFDITFQIIHIGFMFTLL